MPMTIAEKLAANAGPKCCICTKSVYKPEEVRALNKVWHKSCFCCSSTAKDGCGRVLSIMEGYLVHDERIPYCKSCYNKLYAPKGVNASLAGTIEVGRSAGAGQADKPPASDTSCNFTFATAGSERANAPAAVEKLAADVGRTSITSSDTGPPKRRVSAGGMLFESAAAAAAANSPTPAPAPTATATATAPENSESPAPAPARRNSHGASRRGSGSTNPGVVGSGNDRVAADLAAAREAYAAQREADAAAASASAANASASASSSTRGPDKSLPVNSVFAAAASPAPAPAPAPAAAKATPYRSSAPAAAAAPAPAPATRSVSSIASAFGGKSTGSSHPSAGTTKSATPAQAPAPWLKKTAPEPAPAPAPAPAPVSGYVSRESASEPTPAAAPAAAPTPTANYNHLTGTTIVQSGTSGETDNVMPTPVVFASAFAGASSSNEPKRRGSGGPIVGGNLNKHVHKEAAPVLDGNEVDEDEWA